MKKIGNLTKERPSKIRIFSLPSMAAKKYKNLVLFVQPFGH
jgi:hypothetical protein